MYLFTYHLKQSKRVRLQVFILSNCKLVTVVSLTQLFVISFAEIPVQFSFEFVVKVVLNLRFFEERNIDAEVIAVCSLRNFPDQFSVLNRINCVNKA